MKKVIASLLSVLMIGGQLISMKASATTVGDVIAYARSVGMPEDMVQSYIAMGSGREYTSEQCDQAIEILSIMYFERDDAISSGQNTTEQPPEEIEPEKFEEMNLEEKKEYITSIPQESKQEYLDLMTNDEKNQLFKQLDTGQQVEMISGLLGLGDAFGYNFSVEDVSEGSIMISARDEDDKLVGVTVLGESVEKTGIPYTVPVLSASALLLLSLIGIIYTIKRNFMA